MTEIIKKTLPYREWLFYMATVLLGIVDLLDPTILTTALGLDSRGKAVVIILLAVIGFMLRKILGDARKAGPK